MATVEEVLNDMSTADVIGSAANIEYLIDNELRIITIPQNGVVLGVEGDKDVNVVHFKMPRMYRGLDLGEGFNIRVNYANAKAELGYFAVVRPDVTEDSISFEWLLGSHALMYVGEIKFAVSLIKSSVDGRIEKKFNTTLGKAQCLTGLDVDVSVPEEDIYDLLTQIKQDVMADIQPSLDGAKADAAAAKQSATQAAESAATATTGAENVRLGVEAVKDAVKIAEQTSAHVDEVKTAVEASATAASSDAAKAEAAKTAAVTAQGKAEAAKTSAEQFKMAAEQAKNDATAQTQAAAQSAEAAEQAKTEASTSKTAAAQSAEAAEQAKTEASTSKTAAAESAKQAKASQDAASTSAQTASTKAEEAKTSADAAKVSETNAKAAENAATSIVENAKIVSDNVLKGEETATLINVTDAWPSKPRGMKIYGQSNQLTTTGKNLVNHAAPLNANGDEPFRGDKLDNGFVIDSTSEGMGIKRIATMNVLGGIKAGDTIIVSCNYKKLSGDIKSPSFYLSDVPQEYGIVINKPYIAKNNHSLVGVYLDADSNSKMEITDFQLIKGSTPIAYEPYTGGKPSPSPDYPQEITNLNKAELVIAGRNICPDAELLGKVSYNSGIPTNKYGVQAKFPYVQASETDGIGAVLNTIKGVTYSIAYLGKANTASVGIAEYKSVDDVGDIGKVVSYALVGSSKKNSLTASIDGVMVFVLASQWTNGTTNLNTFAKEDMIISIGEPQDSYKPHKSKSTAIDLKGNELCSVTEHKEWSPSTFRDDLVIDSEGNVSLIKRVFSAHIDGLESDSLGTTAQFQYFSYAPNTVRPTDGSLAIRSNRFGKIEREPWSFYVAGGSNTAIFFTFPVGTFNDKAALNEWLKINPIDVNYLGAEPQTIPLGKVELPALPEATSNVWNDGNIPANVYIQYLKDVNIAYSDLENQIKQITTALSVTTLEIATK